MSIPPARPWRRRLAWVVGAYLALVLVLSVLGLEPRPIPLAAVVIVAASLLALLADRIPDGSGEQWPTAHVSHVGLGRGSDHRTTALAARLAGMPAADPARRLALASDLHTQLCLVIAQRVDRHDVRQVLTDPVAAAALLPPELADLVSHPPDARLVDPAYLSIVLDRIESLP